MTAKVPVLSERKSRSFWYHDKGYIGQTVGYECPPDYDFWWCPSWGNSAAYGKSLFDTEKEAKEVAIDFLLTEIERLEKQLNKLQA